MKVPSEWSETAPEYRRHAPRLGEHTREVLREAGYSDAQIDALASQRSGSAIIRASADLMFSLRALYKYR